MHGPDADGQKRRRTRKQYAIADALHVADASSKREAGIATQDRDRRREGDEIGIVSFEHDLIGRSVSTERPSPNLLHSRADAASPQSQLLGAVPVRPAFQNAMEERF